MTGIGASFAVLGLAQRLKAILPYIGCGLAVLLLCGALWLRGNHYRNQRDEARTAAKEQVAEYRRVYNETFAAHWKAKLAEDDRRQHITQEADNATLPRRTGALDAAAAYRASHSLRSCPTDPSGSPGGNLPSSTAAAGSAAPSTALADMVAISPADHDACTLNSADLGIVYEWAKGLAE